MMFYDDENKNPEGNNIPDSDNREIKEDKPEVTPEQTAEPQKTEEEAPRENSGYTYGSYNNNNYNSGNKNEYGYTVYNSDNNGKKQKNSNAYMSKKAVGWIVALCLVVSIICGVCANAVTGALRGNVGETTTTQEPLGTETSSTTVKVPVATTPISTDGAKDIPTVTAVVGGKKYTELEDAIEQCVNSVVQIEVTEDGGKDIFGRDTVVSGAGSGVIFSKDGYIVTNYHVAGAKTKTIKVILYDGTTYEGNYISGDESLDVSVIKINKNDCSAVKIGDSSSLRLGTSVFTIGNPLGLGISVSEGIISASPKAVTVEQTTMMLMRTTAAINSGNSGGGLFNMNGELIGITNAKIGGTSVESMGYAIPSEKIIKCINDFSKYGYVTGVARLGVRATDYIKIGRYQYQGLVNIVSVTEGGTASVAGITAGDIIYSVDGVECSSMATLTEILTKYKVGDTVTLTILRPGDAANSAVSYNAYLKACEEIQLQVTFVEFNPNT